MLNNPFWPGLTLQFIKCCLALHSNVESIYINTFKIQTCVQIKSEYRLFVLVCRSTVLRCEHVYKTNEGLLYSSGLSFLPLCSNHMRVELSDDDGDVITVHASQLLGQRQHFWQPLVVDCAKLVISDGVAHQVGRRVLILESWRHASLPLFQQPLHLSQRDPVASNF